MLVGCGDSGSLVIVALLIGKTNLVGLLNLNFVFFFFSFDYVGTWKRW